MITAAEYQVSPYRYAKGQLVIHCRRGPDCYKTRAMRLAEALRGRWAHRAGGYVVSPAKVARFEALYAAGWDASSIDGTLYPPPDGKPQPTARVGEKVGHSPALKPAPGAYSAARVRLRWDLDAGKWTAPA